jgi:ABC-type antimicrobial peptide transport system permease subunit
MGAYALMSFTVAQRRREIGIRAALGAGPRRLLLSIFARALGQLALGAVVGFALAVGLDAAAPQGLFMPERGPLLLLAVAALMIGIGVVATIGPARRGLAIPPTEALQEG